MENIIIRSCLNVAFELQKNGCLFVIELGDRKKNYYDVIYPIIVKQDGKKLSILEDKDKPFIKKLAELDGAVIINNSGCIEHFGVTLKRSENFMGHGKRHAFALATSKIKDVVCILASEEDHHIRTFREGVCIADLDSKTKLPLTIEQKIVEILNNPISKTMIASGIAASVLTLNPIPAIITITGSHVIISHGFERLKEFF